jgi:hypothetical protein
MPVLHVGSWVYRYSALATRHCIVGLRANALVAAAGLPLIVWVAAFWLS